MYTNTSWIGKTVRLKTNYLSKAHEINKSVSEKAGRPHLIVCLSVNGEKKLFALPNYSQLSETVDNVFRTVFTPRLKTPDKKKHAVVYSLMIPIDEGVIAHKFFENGKTPVACREQEIELANIKSRKLETIPEKAQDAFMTMQRLCAPKQQEDGKNMAVGIEVFKDAEFRQAYKKVVRALYSRYIIEASENLKQITDKAQRYLDKHYIPYSKGENVKMPKFITDINALAEFLNSNKTQRNMERHALFFANLEIDPNTVNYGVHFVSADEIRELNKIHRGKDKVTDVLSFPLLHITAGQKPTKENFPLDFNPETNKIELGDIVINKNETDKDFLIEHGLMHLLGYHHKGDE